MYKSILIATDGSALSKKAISAGIELAVLTGASVTALKVVQRYPLSYFEGGTAISASEVAKTEKQWFNRLLMRKGDAARMTASFTGPG